MKIKPDLTGCENDGYDDKTIRYFEEIDEQGYFYELYVIAGRRKAAVVITDAGVSVDFVHHGMVHTNIVPERIFPNQTKLDWDQITRILHVLEDTGLEGRVYTKKQKEDLFKRWEREG